MRRRYETSWTRGALAAVALGSAVGGAVIVSCIGDNGVAPVPSAGSDASPADGALPDSTAPALDGTAGDSAPATDATSASDSGATDGGPATDSSTDGSSASADSGADAADATDAADAAPPPCAPGSVAAFVPPPYVHANALSLAATCSVGDVLGLANSCAVGASTFESCSTYPIEATFWGSSPACVACLTTPEITLPDDAGPPSDAGDAAAAPTYGAAIVTRVTVPNVAGCIEQNDTSDAGLPCAIAMQAAWRCEEFACNPTCPVTDDASEAAYFACAQSAAATVCKSYADPAAACLAAEADAGSTAYSACLQTSVTTTGSSTLSAPATQFFDVGYSFCN